MIKSVVEKDTLTTWSVGEVIFGKKIVKIEESWDGGAEITLYGKGKRPFDVPLVRIPMTSVQRIIYEVGE